MVLVWDRGAQVLFHGRLAEVVHPGDPLRSPEVEVVDEGGIAHRYTVLRGVDVKPLTRPGECVLDAVRRATETPTSAFKQCERIAERWLAAPRVGDMFALPDNERLELVEIKETGEIWAKLSFPMTAKAAHKATAALKYRDVRDFRQQMAYASMPVYRVRAFATMRKEFENSELVGYMPGSPLWIGVKPVATEE